MVLITCLIDVILISTHNIYFHYLKKIFCGYPFLSGAMGIYVVGTQCKTISYELPQHIFSCTILSTSLGKIFCMAFQFKCHYFALTDHILTETICFFCFCVLFSYIYPKIKFTAKNWSDLCNFYSKVFFFKFLSKKKHFLLFFSEFKFLRFYNNTLQRRYSAVVGIHERRPRLMRSALYRSRQPPPKFFACMIAVSSCYYEMLRIARIL